jgi:hypothetical protein
VTHMEETRCDLKLFGRRTLRERPLVDLGINAAINYLYDTLKSNRMRECELDW